MSLLEDAKRSRSVTVFLATAVILMITLIVTTVWAYGRLYTARTNIPDIHYGHDI